MGVVILERPAPASPSARGYHAVYRRDEPNRCPSCSHRHWYVGRLSAECGFCGTALPLAEAGMTGGGMVRRAAFEEAA